MPFRSDFGVHGKPGCVQECTEVRIGMQSMSMLDMCVRYAGQS